MAFGHFSLSRSRSLGAIFPAMAHVHSPSSLAAPSLSQRIRAALQRTAVIVRRIIGVPDYETYLEHMRQHYPDCTPLDPTTFERERMADRYIRGGTRCC